MMSTMMIVTRDDDEWNDNGERWVMIDELLINDDRWMTRSTMMMAIMDDDELVIDDVHDNEWMMMAKMDDVEWLINDDRWMMIHMIMNEWWWRQ